MPGHDTTDAVRVLLELVASERPDTISAVVELLGNSPACGAFAELMETWRAETPDEVAEIAIKASYDLNRLEEWRNVPWNQFKEWFYDPNLTALRDLARQRATRTLAIRKRRQREIIADRLWELVELDRIRQELEAWLAEPMAPVEPERLARWLPRPRKS